MDQEVTVIGHVYKIINEKTGSFYIGGSTNTKKRFQTHMRDLSNKKHHSFVFQAEYDTHGKDAFRLEILGEYPKDELKSAEQDHIDRLQPCLNVSRLAGCGDLISYHPNRDALVEKMTESIKSRFDQMTTEEKSAVYGKPGKSNPMFGKTHGANARKKISDANKGNQYRLGSTWSEDQRTKCVAFAKTRTSNKNSFYGQTHSAETKAKLSSANKGKLPPNTRKVSIDGAVYESASAAARALGVSGSLIHYRVKKSPKFGIYQYVN